MSKWTDLAQYHGGHDAVCGPNRARQVPGASEWGRRRYWYVCGRCGAGHAVRRAVTNTYCYAQGDSDTAASSDAASETVSPYSVGEAEFVPNRHLRAERFRRYPLS